MKLLIVQLPPFSYYLLTLSCVLTFSLEPCSQKSSLYFRPVIDILTGIYIQMNTRINKFVIVILYKNYKLTSLLLNIYIYIGGLRSVPNLSVDMFLYCRQQTIRLHYDKSSKAVHGILKKYRVSDAITEGNA
jgi:hypothetical protein